MFAGTPASGTQGAHCQGAAIWRGVTPRPVTLAKHQAAPAAQCLALDNRGQPLPIQAAGVDVARGSRIAFAAPNRSSAVTYKAQTGVSLLESLIAMLLLMLTGLGIVFVNARSLGDQQQLQQHALALSKAREQLQQGTLPCDSAGDWQLASGVAATARLNCNTVPAVTLRRRPQNGGAEIAANARLRGQTLSVRDAASALSP